jgi:hemolysin III
VTTEHRLGEIVANAVTHGIGAALAITGVIVLVIVSVTHGTARLIISCGIFGGTLLLVYICSTLYHSLVRTRARHVFQILDHSAIYVLIAGTYTPFTVVSLRGKLGWALLIIVWTLAVAGVVFKSLALGRFPTASVAVYVLMGWLAVIAMRPLIRAIGWHGLCWLGAGGVFYTAGILFFAFDRARYFHALWHVFVLAGSISHYFAVLLYVVPNASRT